MVPSLKALTLGKIYSLSKDVPIFFSTIIFGSDCTHS